MGPVNGWPLWVWLRACDGVAGSKMEHLLDGGARRRMPSAGHDNLSEFLHRVIRRYPNSVLAADADELYGRVLKRYRSSRRAIEGRLPSPCNSIGYLTSAVDWQQLPTIAATGYASLYDHRMSSDVKHAICSSAQKRSEEMQKKRNRDLSGEAREAAVLMIELREVLKNETRISGQKSIGATKRQAALQPVGADYGGGNQS